MRLETSKDVTTNRIGSRGLFLCRVCIGPVVLRAVSCRSVPHLFLDDLVPKRVAVSGHCGAVAPFHLPDGQSMVASSPFTRRHRALVKFFFSLVLFLQPRIKIGTYFTKFDGFLQLACVDKGGVSLFPVELFRFRFRVRFRS